ncbi:GHKL domain-containing protein [Pedobacter panaciterrae]
MITFIENAFKHVSRGISEAYVKINFEQAAKSVCLEIENSKSNIQQEKDSVSGLGLDNIRKRLDILYANDYSLTIKDSETTYYTKLVIKI